MMSSDTTSIYSYNMDSIRGESVDLADYKGKVLLIVNTASKCGYTKQYDGLEELYDTYKDDGLVVMGFPANNFGGQEPGSDEEILEFCTNKFAVSFPMFSKVSVKGKEQHPLFEELTTTENPDFVGPINWNFEKFLISKDGELLHRFRSKVEPNSKTLVSAIETALQQ